MTAKNIYIAMYRALDCLYDEQPYDELGNFLSEANLSYITLEEWKELCNIIDEEEK